MKKALVILLLAGVVGAVLGRLSYLGIFMFDIDRIRYAQDDNRPPDDDDEDFHRFTTRRHNCFTCYVISTHLAEQGGINIWEPKQYRIEANPTPIHKRIDDQVTIDRYQYPPQFMLVSKLLFLFSRDFFTLRAIWYMVNIVIISLAMIWLARWCSGGFVSVAVGVCLLPFLSPAVLTSLQFGNVHLMVIAMSILGMLCAQTGRNRTAGFLLGFVTVSKIFPGLLILYLMFRRNWKAVNWSIITGVGLTLLTLVIFGWEPYRYFFEYQVPRLANGDAFDFTRTSSRPIALNMSFYGLAFKMSRLEMIDTTDPDALKSLANVVQWIFTGITFALLILLGRREQGDFDRSRMRYAEAGVWLVLLVFAQMRSGFLPWTYGMFAPLWLVTLMIPAGTRWHKRILPLSVLWVWIAVSIPTPFGPNTSQFAMFYSLVAWMLVMTICVGVAGLRVGVTPDMPVVTEPHDRTLEDTKLPLDPDGSRS